MGLDMYLERMPRYKGYNAQTVSVIEDYLHYQDYLKEPDSKKISFKQWYGKEADSIPSSDAVEFYSKFYSVKDNHMFPHVYEEIGYWRKANAVHNWFVEHIQDGIDDCNFHREVTADDLRELRDLCDEVVRRARLVSGQIHTGMRFHPDGSIEQIHKTGKIVSNPSVCENLMPTEGGFFFGSTDYDEYYIDGLRRTIEICEFALETTDFDKQMIYYCSSW